MTVYVDDWRQVARVGQLRARWSHLTADSRDELMTFAARLGLRPAWVQHDDDPVMRHFDVTESKRLAAIRAGATAITWREAGLMVAARRQQQTTREVER
jgi:hypothetical protein